MVHWPKREVYPLDRVRTVSLRQEATMPYQPPHSGSQTAAQEARGGLQTPGAGGKADADRHSAAFGGVHRLAARRMGSTRHLHQSWIGARGHRLRRHLRAGLRGSRWPWLPTGIADDDKAGKGPAEAAGRDDMSTKTHPSSGSPTRLCRPCSSAPSAITLILGAHRRLILLVASGWRNAAMLADGRRHFGGQHSGVAAPDPAHQRQTGPEEDPPERGSGGDLLCAPAHRLCGRPFMVA